MIFIVIYLFIQIIIKININIINYLKDKTKFFFVKIKMGNFTSKYKNNKLEQPLLKNMEDTYIFDEKNNSNETINTLEYRIIQLEQKCNENFKKIQNHTSILRDDLQTIINNQFYLEKKIKNIENYFKK